MGVNSKIEWTENTFNPWIGCAKISPACDHCYAADLSARTFKVKWGAGEARKRTSEAYWKQPLKWNDDYEVAYQRYSDAQEQANHIGVLFSEVEPMRPRVFCASLADVFDNEVPDEWRADLFDLIRKTPNLDWMLLTKRIGNARAQLSKAHLLVLRRIANEGRFNERGKENPIWGLGLWLQGWVSEKPPENLHLGITICNQTEADRDIPKLLATSAAKRFLSIEPMLGPIDLNLGWRNDTWREDSDWCGRPLPMRKIDLVIAGGESGPRARPSHPDWFRSLRDQCDAANVPFMFKQWGKWAPYKSVPGGDEGGLLRSGKVRYLQGDGREPDGHFRRGDAAMIRIGKKAGRFLDGVEHNGRIAL